MDCLVFVFDVFMLCYGMSFQEKLLECDYIFAFQGRSIKRKDQFLCPIRLCRRECFFLRCDCGIAVFEHQCALQSVFPAGDEVVVCYGVRDRYFFSRGGEMLAGHIILGCCTDRRDIYRLVFVIRVFMDGIYLVCAGVLELFVSYERRSSEALSRFKAECYDNTAVTAFRSRECRGSSDLLPISIFCGIFCFFIDEPAVHDVFFSRGQVLIFYGILYRDSLIRLRHMSAGLLVCCCSPDLREAHGLIFILGIIQGGNSLAVFIIDHLVSDNFSSCKFRSIQREIDFDLTFGSVNRVGDCLFGKCLESLCVHQGAFKLECLSFVTFSVFIVHGIRKCYGTICECFMFTLAVQKFCAEFDLFVIRDRFREPVHGSDLDAHLCLRIFCDVKFIFSLGGDVSFRCFYFTKGI